jgi:hypothetical protein
MPKSGKYIFCRTVCIACTVAFFYSLLLLPVGLFAQVGDKALYDQAVDRFNFTTIRYVLADDKQKPEAGKLATQLEELQGNPDSLVSKIIGVYGPNSKTQILSTTINGFKNKFVNDQSLSRQLANVSKFIREDRKGKSYLPQLENDLQSIAEEMLVKEAEQAGKDNTKSRMQKASLTSADMATQAEAPVSRQAETPGWLLLLTGIIGVLSLANLYLLYKHVLKKRTSHSGKEDSHRTVYQVRDFEIFPRMEKNTEALEKKIEELRKEMYALAEERKNGPIPVTEQPKAPVAMPVPVEQREPVQKPVTQPALVEPGKVVELQVNKNLPADGLKTSKKYADYPKENGFVMSQLQDSSDRRSIYEITIPPDSDYAQFTIVDNKELHEYAIQNRERLLKDACDFEVSSSQHTRIEVLRPGKLQKNGNTWQIRHKAQIKFV